ncbi:hypothetical protein DFJ73DRAFT_861422 [Zopfochytrium polystomum]|nr:hypothetical protein DFJ73DRAFT_861422 [Zopfochytrium polystomum]
MKSARLGELVDVSRLGEGIDMILLVADTKMAVIGKMAMMERAVVARSSGSSAGAAAVTAIAAEQQNMQQQQLLQQLLLNQQQLQRSILAANVRKPVGYQPIQSAGAREFSSLDSGSGSQVLLLGPNGAAYVPVPRQFQSAPAGTAYQNYVVPQLPPNKLDPPDPYALRKKRYLFIALIVFASILVLLGAGSLIYILVIRKPAANGGANTVARANCTLTEIDDFTKPYANLLTQTTGEGNTLPGVTWSQTINSSYLAFNDPKTTSYYYENLRDVQFLATGIQCAPPPTVGKYLVFSMSGSGSVRFNVQVSCKKTPYTSDAFNVTQAVRVYAVNMDSVAGYVGAYTDMSAIAWQEFTSVPVDGATTVPWTLRSVRAVSDLVACGITPDVVILP